MEPKSKFKLNLRTGEIEIEGSEEFIEKQILNLSSLAELFIAVSKSEPIPEDDSESELDSLLDSSGKDPDTKVFEVPDSFGEFYHKFRDDTTDKDKALIAGYFVQSKSAKNEFKTIEVNKILKELGIKLSNPTTSIKYLANDKYVFQTRKEGALHYMRVSQDGLEYLKTLLNK